MRKYYFERETIMNEKIVEIEAKTEEDAEAQVKSRLSEGLYVLSKRVLSDGRPQIASAIADTTESAFVKAQCEVPTNANILEKKEIYSYAQRTITVQAFTEHEAESKARADLAFFRENWILKSIKITVKGKNGVLGIGKIPNQYEVDVFWQSKVVIKYSENVKIVFRLGTLEEGIRMLETGNDTERLQAASALGKIGNKQAVDPLCEALKDNFHFVRASAAIALGMINDKKAVAPLISALWHEHALLESAAFSGLRFEVSYLNPRFVLQNVMEALAKIGDPSAVEPIGNVLSGSASSRDKNIWFYAVEYLGEIGNSSACRYIIPVLLNNEDSDKRKQASRNLGRIGGSMATNALAQALDKEQSDDVKKEIEKALEEAKK